jgi:predicted permease
VRLLIPPLSRATRVAHVALVLAAAVVAALLAVLPEDDPRRKIVSTVLTVLVPILIVQVMVESRLSGAPVTYRIPYALSAAAAILMIIAQSLRGPVMTPSSEISGILFAVAIIVLAFQVLRLPNSPDD